MSRLLAQSSVNLGNISGIGPYGQNSAGPNTAVMMFVSLISNTIGLMTILAGIYFLFQLIISGYRWISSGGDKQDVSDAQKRITNSLIGIVLVVAAYSLNALIGYILGLDTINIGGLIIDNLTP